MMAQIGMTMQRRHLLLPLILAVHIALILLLALHRTPLIPPRTAAGALSIFDVALIEPAPAPAPPPPVIDPPIVIIAPPPPPPTTPAPMEPTDGQGVASGACDVAAIVTKALSESAVVAAAMARVPRQSRSVANAIMLWDGEWVTLPIAGRDTLAPIRAEILVALGRMPIGCQSAPQAGPELIPFVIAGQDTVMLAIGSGNWRWSDLPSSGARLLQRSNGLNAINTP